VKALAHTETPEEDREKYLVQNMMGVNDDIQEGSDQFCPQRLVAASIRFEI